MGWTYEVEAWVVVAQVNFDKKYGYMPVYTGESLLRAIWEARKAKKYSGCVRFSWR